MAPTREKKTPYSEHIDARLNELRTETRKIVDIANAAGAQAPELFQWRTGLRPVPWQRARQLAAALETEPELVSQQYREIAAGAGGIANQIAEDNAGYQPHPVRPDKEILLETVQIAVELLLKKQEPLTADDALSCYESALRRRAARTRTLERDHPRPNRARTR